MGKSELGGRALRPVGFAGEELGKSMGDDPAVPHERHIRADARCRAHHAYAAVSHSCRARDVRRGSPEHFPVDVEYLQLMECHPRRAARCARR
jgi:hypothetical protein